jgi:prepilin-type N-terminal cleavage/methylation domain-containing protein/prepilin-type processing-associated H-X9-DG protein
MVTLLSVSRSCTTNLVRAFCVNVRNQCGLTMIEILVVIVIIGILAALSIPALNSSKERVRSAECLNNLRQIHIALELYANEHEDLYPLVVDAATWNSTDPATTGWMQRLTSYLKEKKVLTCPAQPRSMKNDFSYFLNTRAAYVQAGKRASVSRANIQLPSQFIMAADSLLNVNIADPDKDNATEDRLFGSSSNQAQLRSYHSKSVNILFADGHMKSYKTFVPSEMTYAYNSPGADYASVSSSEPVVTSSPPAEPPVTTPPGSGSGSTGSGTGKDKGGSGGEKGGPKK